MKQLFTPFLLLLLFSISKFVQAQSDLCNPNATLLTVDSLCQFTAGSTINLINNDPYKASCALSFHDDDDDGWYRFIALSDQTIINVMSATGYDHVVAVLESCTQEISCSNKSYSGGIESLTVQTDVGKTYYVYIFEKASGGGDFSICLTKGVSCVANIVPSDDCSNAPLINSFENFCGTTSGYTLASPPGHNPDCGISLQNDSWMRFIASETEVEIDWSIPSGDKCSSGLQFQIYAGNCNALTPVPSTCFNPTGGVGSTGKWLIPGLIPGNTYYIMMDGYAGNECNYYFNPAKGIEVLCNADAGDWDLTNFSDTICIGNNLSINTSNFTSDTGYVQYIILVDSLENMRDISAGSNYNNPVLDWGTSVQLFALNTNDTTLISQLQTGAQWSGITDLDDNGACVDIVGPQLLTLSKGLSINEVFSTDPMCFASNDGWINLSVNGGLPPYTYNWSQGGLTDSISQLGSGQFSVSISDQAGCSTTTSVQLNAPSRLDLFFMVDQPTCNNPNGGRIATLVSGGKSPYSYVWSDPLFQQVSVQSNLDGGTYALTVTDANNCTESGNIVLDSLSPLNLEILSFNNIKCKGDSDGGFHLKASGGIPPYQFSLDNSLWQNDSVFMQLPTGNYVAYLKDGAGCTNSLNINLPEPKFDLVTAWDKIRTIDTVCYGSNNGALGILVSGGVINSGGNYVVQWTNAAGTFQDSALLLTNLLADTYTVKITDDAGCMREMIKAVNSRSEIKSNIKATDTIVCSGDSLLLKAVGSGGKEPYLYLWNHIAGDSSLWSIGGESTLQIVDQLACSSLVSSVGVQVNTEIQVSINSPQNVCYGNPVQLKAIAQGGSGFFDYDWFYNNSVYSQGISQISGPAGFYEVLVRDTIKSNGYCVGSAFVQVPEFPELVLEINGQRNLCFGDSAHLVANVSGGAGVAYSYMWKNVEMDTIVSVRNFIVAQAGRYEITVKDGYDCALFDTIQLIENEQIVPNFVSQSPLNAQFTTDVVLLNKTQVPERSEFVNFEWDFGDNTIENSNDTLPVFHLYEQPGSYNVCLTATIENCITKKCDKLKVDPQHSLFIPNVFSTHSSSINRSFYAKGEGIEKFRLLLYNRWGKQITVLNNINEQWNGRTEDGIYVPAGVYMWVATYRPENSYTKVLSGTVTVLR